jgi:hypothetical protein
MVCKFPNNIDYASKDFEYENFFWNNIFCFVGVTLSQDLECFVDYLRMMHQFMHV